MADIGASDGVDSNLKARSDLTATTTRIYIHDMFSAGGLRTTGGIIGGVLVIENTDPVNDLYLGGGNGSQVEVSTNGFRIFPGATVTIQLGGRIGSLDIFSGNFLGLFLFTLTGSATFSIMLAPAETDTLDQLFGFENVSG